MPLPKNKNVEEWKRDISLSRLELNKYEIDKKAPKIKINKSEIQINNMSNEQLIGVHSKLHAIKSDVQSNLKENDVLKLHGMITTEYESRKLRHPRIDDLDG